MWKSYFYLDNTTANITVQKHLMFGANKPEYMENKYPSTCTGVAICPSSSFWA